MLSCVSEVPGAHVKDAEVRVRERSVVSGGVRAFFEGGAGVGLVAAPRSVAPQSPSSDTVQLSSELQPAEGTGRPFHTDVPGEDSVARD